MAMARTIAAVRNGGVLNATERMRLKLKEVPGIGKHEPLPSGPAEQAVPGKAHFAKAQRCSG